MCVNFWPKKMFTLKWHLCVAIDHTHYTMPHNAPKPPNVGKRFQMCVCVVYNPHIRDYLCNGLRGYIHPAAICTYHSRIPIMHFVDLFIAYILCLLHQVVVAKNTTINQLGLGLFWQPVYLVYFAHCHSECGVVTYSDDF